MTQRNSLEGENYQKVFGVHPILYVNLWSVRNENPLTVYEMKRNPPTKMNTSVYVSFSSPAKRTVAFFTNLCVSKRPWQPSVTRSFGDITWLTRSPIITSQDLFGLRKYTFCDQCVSENVSTAVEDLSAWRKYQLTRAGKNGEYLRRTYVASNAEETFANCTLL